MSSGKSRAPSPVSHPAEAADARATTDAAGSPDTAADGPARLPGLAPRTVDAQAMKAFAHPLRMAIYSHLTDVGSATATALARHLGESTGQTSYHLRQLEKHGFVAEDAGRGTGRERWWKPVGFALPTFDLAQDEANRPAIQALMRNRLHERADALARWLSVETTEEREWIEASVDNTTTRTLTAAQARALTEELMAVIARHLGPADAHPSARRGDAGAPDPAAGDGGPGPGGGGPDPAADVRGPEDGASATGTPGPGGATTATDEPTRRVRLYLSVFPLPAGEVTDAPGPSAGVGMTAEEREPSEGGPAADATVDAEVAAGVGIPAPDVRQDDATR